MRVLTILLCLLLLSTPAWAGVDGADFDNLPQGPYTGTATVSPPGAPGVDVVPDGQSFLGAANLGNGSGNMLRIDTVNNPGPITITFTFTCDIVPQAICQIEYMYSGAAWGLGAGFAVYVDDPTLTNPDDWWEPPVGVPPTTVEPGTNKENTGPCDGTTHTITFVVWPGTILHLNNMTTQCIEDVIPNYEHSWSAIKAMYR